MRRGPLCLPPAIARRGGQERRVAQRGGRAPSAGVDCNATSPHPTGVCRALGGHARNLCPELPTLRAPRSPATCPARPWASPARSGRGCPPPSGRRSPPGPSCAAGETPPPPGTAGGGQRRRAVGPAGGAEPPYYGLGRPQAERRRPCLRQRGGKPGPLQAESTLGCSGARLHPQTPQGGPFPAPGAFPGSWPGGLSLPISPLTPNDGGAGSNQDPPRGPFLNGINRTDLGEGASKGQLSQQPP